MIRHVLSFFPVIKLIQNNAQPFLLGTSYYDQVYQETWDLLAQYLHLLIIRGLVVILEPLP